LDLVSSSGVEGAQRFHRLPLQIIIVHNAQK
jgi:hypothetical protein